ncbi:MAG: FtsW/RodA/SpoVE family cell cycle protein [Planctomycetaceae bacterium]
MSSATAWQRFPWTIPVCAVLLSIAGLLGLSRGDELTGQGAFALRQTIWMVVAFPIFLATVAVPYRLLKPWCTGGFLVSLLLLIGVYLFPAKFGSHRWIPLGFADLQPSEFAKLTFIMMLAHHLMYEQNHRTLRGLMIPFALTLVPLLLILREPDLGTSLLFLPILFGMLIAAGAKWRHLLLVTISGLAVTPLVWTAMSSEQKSRVTTLFQQTDSGFAPQGDGYHLHQSKLMIALGGTTGSYHQGAAVDDPFAYHLPASRTDFVFCLIAERWGFLGVLTVTLLYLTLFASGLWIAAKTQDPFGRLLAVGIVILLASQMLINIGMTVGLMPITGLTLPLMSYGGSSFVVTMIALGLLANISLRPGYEVTGAPFRFRD